MEEQWKAVEGFELYEVSDHGRVRNKNTGRLRASGRSSKYGHRTMPLFKNGRLYTKSLHRLVLCAHGVPEPFPGAHCRHMDGDPTNNCSTNLAWGSRRDNFDDMVLHGRYVALKPTLGGQHHNAKLTEEDILCIRAEPYFRGVAVMLGAAFGVRHQTIVKIRAGALWKHLTDPFAAKTPPIESTTP